MLMNYSFALLGAHPLAATGCTSGAIHLYTEKEMLQNLHVGNIQTFIFVL